MVILSYRSEGKEKKRGICPDFFFFLYILWCNMNGKRRRASAYINIWKDLAVSFPLDEKEKEKKRDFLAQIARGDWWSWWWRTAAAASRFSTRLKPHTPSSALVGQIEAKKSVISHISCRLACRFIAPCFSFPLSPAQPNPALTVLLRNCNRIGLISLYGNKKK